MISNGRVNKNYTAPDCGLAPNCTVERRGDINSKLTCQFNYPGAIGQVSLEVFFSRNFDPLFVTEICCFFETYTESYTESYTKSYRLQYQVQITMLPTSGCHQHGVSLFGIEPRLISSE